MREFTVGDLVLVKIPGRNGKMEESWKGPYVILEMTTEVNCSGRGWKEKRDKWLVYMYILKSTCAKNLFLNLQAQLQPPRDHIYTAESQ